MLEIPFNVVAFDLDGTLADTAPDLAGSLNHTLQTIGREAIPAEQVRKLIGHGARALLRRALALTGEASDEMVEQGYRIFIDHYSSNICVGTSLYPGIEKALDALVEAGLEIAVCTNKPEALTLALLDALGLSDRFAAVIAGDTLPVRKPDPAPLREAVLRSGGGRAVFVGDSVVDADTAKAAGLPFVAVSFGYSDRPADLLGADRIINGYDELVPALSEI